MPPEPIADVLGAVLMLLGIRDTSWLSMKKFLGNRGVKEDILNFDARRIDPQLRAKVVNSIQAGSHVGGFIFTHGRTACRPLLHEELKTGVPESVSGGWSFLNADCRPQSYACVLENFQQIYPPPLG